MSSPVLLKLIRAAGAEVTVNMARVLFIDPSEDGAIIHMNIPDSTIAVRESPKEIRHLTREEQKEL